LKKPDRDSQNRVQELAAQQVDLVKIWSHSQDGFERPSHQDKGAGGVGHEVREIQERFSNGLLYPLESGAPASEVVRCRCALLVVPRDEVKQWL